MNCLLDLIGIEGCGGVTPSSSLNINRLPGIELKAIDKLATPDQVNFEGVWDDIQNRSIRKFKSAVNAKFRKRWQLKTITQSIDLGRKFESDITAMGSGYRGFSKELYHEGSDFSPSNMQVVYCKALYLYLGSAVNTTIKIYDLDLNTELFSYNLTGAIGWNTITVNQYFSAGRIGFVYDSSTVDSVKLDISKLENYNNGFGSDTCDCVCYDFAGSNVRVRGIDTDSTIDNIEFGINTFGLSGIFSIQCAYDSIVCNNLPVFETAFWYLTGAEFCFERRFTSRLNEFTTFDKNKAKELGEEYEKRFNEELDLVIDGINLDGSDFCIECNEQFMYSDAKL